MNETRQQIVDLCSILHSSRRDLQRAANAVELVEARLNELKRELADPGANRESKGDESREHHNAYVEPLDGGWGGFQARCWDCDWRGTELLRGGELMGTDESRAHKNKARKEAAEHRYQWPAHRPADQPSREQEQLENLTARWSTRRAASRTDRNRSPLLLPGRLAPRAPHEKKGSNHES